MAPVETSSSNLVKRGCKITLTLIRELARGNHYPPLSFRKPKGQSPSERPHPPLWDRVRDLVTLRPIQMVTRHALVRGTNLEPYPEGLFWPAHTGTLLEAAGVSVLLAQIRSTLSVPSITWLRGSIMGRERDSPEFPSSSTNECWKPVFTERLPYAGSLLSCP